MWQAINGHFKVAICEGNMSKNELSMSQARRAAELEGLVQTLKEERDVLAAVANGYKSAVDDLSRAYADAHNGLNVAAVYASELLEDYRAVARERAETITRLVQAGLGSAAFPPSVLGGSAHLDSLLTGIGVARSRLRKVRLSPSFLVARILKLDVSRPGEAARSVAAPMSVDDAHRMSKALGRELELLMSSETYKLARRISRIARRLISAKNEVR